VESILTWKGKNRYKCW